MVEENKTILNFDELKNILENGDFDKLLSKRESEVFEAKSKKPYNLPDKKAILEILKDTASFANNKGGFIVCGLTTGRFESSPHDIVQSLSVFEKEEFYSEAQINGILDSNICPKLSVKVSWIPYNKDNTKGLGVITILAKEENQKPFIVKIVETDASGEYFGVPTRTDDGTTWLKVSDLYKLAKRGPNNFQDLHQVLSAQIAELKDNLLEAMPKKTVNVFNDIDSIPYKINETIYGK